MTVSKELLMDNKVQVECKHDMTLAFAVGLLGIKV